MSNIFLSVGAMKAGTTWLYENIKNHSDLLFSEEKEIHFWANRVGIEDQLSAENRIIKFKMVAADILNGNSAYISQNIDKLRWYLNYADGDAASIEWYLKLFPNRVEAKYICDFSNLYAQMEREQWTDLNNTFKDKKVIYTLRDPIKRIWSHYKFHLKFIGSEDEVYNHGFDGFKSLLEEDYFWSNAQYQENYNNLISSFGAENVKILYFEDFRSNPQLMLDEVCDFLSIKKLQVNKELSSEKINSTKEFKMPEQWREYVLEKLSDEIKQLKDNGLWHESWEEL
jgi:hypothetical protein